MQQTALNLVAIAIFTVTLSSLLGPVLNISPVFPALTTFGVLGLATLDNFTWGGKGTTLVLDLFASSKQRDRVLHHEAGHFLVAYFLSIPITGYTLSAWEAFKQKQAGMGGVIVDTALLEKKLDIKEMPLLVERFCTMWMAGIAAETLVYGNTEGGESDRSQLKKVLHFTGFPESAATQKERWAFLQAKSILEKHQDAYQALVEAMERRESVEECVQAIQKHS
jgi:hypothetical protein